MVMLKLLVKLKQQRAVPTLLLIGYVRKELSLPRNMTICYHGLILTRI